jgi:hypothetical protein
MIAVTILFVFMTQQPLVGQGFIIEASRSHPETPFSIRLLWTRDQPSAETSPLQHNIHKRQTSMPPAEFEPAIPASVQPPTYALDPAATGIGDNINFRVINPYATNVIYIWSTYS